MITELQGQKISSRDAEVLSGLWQGLSNKEIAKKMRIGTRGVKQHIWKLAHQFRIDRAAYWPRVRLCYLVALEKGLLTPLIMNVRYTVPVFHRRKKLKPTSK